jgi:hypothetical protein
LNASKVVHGSPRLGDAKSTVVIPGIWTIDASAADTSFLGHSYFADRTSCLCDIYYLFRNLVSPPRFGLRKQTCPTGGEYWVLEP